MEVKSSPTVQKVFSDKYYIEVRESLFEEMSIVQEKLSDMKDSISELDKNIASLKERLLSLDFESTH